MFCSLAFIDLFDFCFDFTPLRCSLLLIPGGSIARLYHACTRALRACHPLLPPPHPPRLRLRSFKPPPPPVGLQYPRLCSLQTPRQRRLRPCATCSLWRFQLLGQPPERGVQPHPKNREVDRGQRGRAVGSAVGQLPWSVCIQRIMEYRFVIPPLQPACTSPTAPTLSSPTALTTAPTARS